MNADNLEDDSVLAHGAGSAVPTGKERRFKIFDTPLKPFPYLATSRLPCDLARLTAYRVSASASTKCEEMTELVFGFIPRGKGFLHWHSPRADCRVELSRPMGGGGLDGTVQVFRPQINRRSFVGYRIRWKDWDTPVPGIMWALKTWEDSFWPVLHSNKGWLWPLVVRCAGMDG